MAAGRPSNTFDEVVADCAGAILRERLVHGVFAYVVGMSAHFDLPSRIGDQYPSHLCQLLSCTRLQ